MTRARALVAVAALVVAMAAVSMTPAFADARTAAAEPANVHVTVAGPDDIHAT